MSAFSNTCKWHVLTVTFVALNKSAADCYYANGRGTQVPTPSYVAPSPPTAPSNGSSPVHHVYPLLFSDAINKSLYAVGIVHARRLIHGLVHVVGHTDAHPYCYGDVRAECDASCHPDGYRHGR